MPRILMVSFHFPPSNAVAVQRSLAFAYHLAELGWDVRILTVNKSCYGGEVDYSLFYPESLKSKTYRLPAINSKKIGFRGKYIDWLAIPDEWGSWLLFSIPKAIYLVKKFKPDVIWSTCPPFVSHIVAGFVSKITKVPWVADYRDPVQLDFIGEQVKGKRWAISLVDRFTVKNASGIVFVTKHSCSLYQKNYPIEYHKKFSCIENGFHDLPGLNRKKLLNIREQKQNKKFKILYSGSIYGGRKLDVFFEALCNLLKSGRIEKDEIEFAFQGFIDQRVLANDVKKYKLKGVVSVLPFVGFEDSVKEMYAADALLLVQNKQFNPQIPAKAYEYIATGRPILGFCHKEGATAELIGGLKNSYVFDSVEGALAALSEVIEAVQRSNISDIDKYSRKAKTDELDQVLHQIIRCN
ncbi:glycosyltransferase [Porticoccus sp. GXU_MW_L64]